MLIIVSMPCLCRFKHTELLFFVFWFICLSVLLINVVCLLQFSSLFLEGISDYVDPGLPFISLSKGLELNTLRMMSQIIPTALKNPRQPFVALSGPSFALELMNNLPTGLTLVILSFIFK